MPVKKGFDKKHWSWISVLLLHVAVIAVIWAWPLSLPHDQGERILAQAGPYNVILIYNPGGWGNSTLEQSTDFYPVLLEIQATLNSLKHNTLIVAYDRATGGLTGQIAGPKELIDDFRENAPIQAEDIRLILQHAPEKTILLVGFSNGGGLAARALDDLGNQDHVVAILAGVAAWSRTTPSDRCLVLNNAGKDTLAAGDAKNIVFGTLESPFRYVWGELTGKPISVGTSLQYPGHEYRWSSPEVGPPIVQFLKKHF